jgi:hypothetical protein
MFQVGNRNVANEAVSRDWSIRCDSGRDFSNLDRVVC